MSKRTRIRPLDNYFRVTNQHYTKLMEIPSSWGENDPVSRGFKVIGHLTAEGWYLAPRNAEKEIEYGPPLGPFTEDACRTMLLMLPRS